MLNRTVIILLVLLYPLVIYSQQYEEQKPFFTELEKELIREYHTCTGDTGKTDIKYILRWKKSINLRTEDPGYQKILKEFILHTGIVKDIIPCQVIKWNQDRMSYLKKREYSLKNNLIALSDSAIDSFAIQKELSRNPTSSFDFDTIPFGISKDLFRRIFSRRYSYTLTNMGKYFIVEHFPWRGSSFILKFFFTRKQKFYKYEIEGYGFPGDSINQYMWPQANMFKEMYEKKFEAPDVLNRIGFFDIKADTLSTYVRWNRDPYTVFIGIGIKNHLYFTVASITNNTVVQKKKKQ
jgi:hypothetical protein